MNPSKGLAPVVVNELGRVLQELKKHTSILLVEQNVTFSQKIGDRFSILSDGKTVTSGTMAELEKKFGSSAQISWREHNVKGREW